MNRWLVMLAVVLSPEPALAHHILGIPHYAYGEDYPQTPVLTYLLEAGPYDVKMTGYPGNPKPGERVTLHVYIHRRGSGAIYEGSVRGSVRQDAVFGEGELVYGPVEARVEERVFKFYPEFEDEANYTVHIEFDVEGVPWIVDLPMVAGEPGSPWAVLGGTLAGLLAFVVVIRALRIKRARSRGRTTGVAHTAAAS